MKTHGEYFELSASDLVGYLNCQHLSELDRAVAEGVKEKPKVWDPMLEVLWERGAAHEQNYVQHLKDAGFEALRIAGVDVSQEAVSQTLDAMKRGTPVIVQGALAHDGWIGLADILRRVETPSALGNWSYEAIDTKLARETKAGAVLQLCLYSDLLRAVQDIPPELMHVVAPWSDFEPQSFRYADYAAYFRKVRRGLRDHLAHGQTPATYPDPKEHCDICQWRSTCDQRRRDDDHLCLVAGISKSQINELQQRGVTTLTALSQLPLPLAWKPERGSQNAYERVREQARIQAERRTSGRLMYELLPVEEGFGLTCLPAPSEGDIFLDLEGDPFVGEHGLEYLFGYQYRQGDSQDAYTGDWAFSRAEEKRAFEAFVDFVMARWREHPDLHIFHYAPYEPAALKRVMGRYATREEEIDRMLRAHLFVDLYGVVRQGLRASVESYSIKKLEPFYGFTRATDLQDANKALRSFEAALELEDVPSISNETKEVVCTYNQDDCASASALRD
jgi:predicted RecB family nuclease